MLFNDIAPADDTDDQEPNYDQDVQGIVRPDIESGNQTPMQFADIQPVAPAATSRSYWSSPCRRRSCSCSNHCSYRCWNLGCGRRCPASRPRNCSPWLAAGSIAAPWFAIPAALGAGLIASGVVGKIQDWFRDNYGPTTGPLSKPYEAAAAEQQPLAYGIGRAAPIVAGMTTGAVSPLVRAASAGIMGGVDVLQQGIEKGFGNVNPTEALGQAAVGAAFPVAREWAGGPRYGYGAPILLQAPQVGEEGRYAIGMHSRYSFEDDVKRETAASVSRHSADEGQNSKRKP